MPVNQNPLFSKIIAIEKLAKASKWARLSHRPIRYLSAIFFKTLIYPSTKKGKRRTAKTFFDQSMEVILPAGMDLYLLGAKAHDSEIRLTKFLMQQLQTGDTFLDVGTHFGYYSLLAAHLVGTAGRVIGVEASAAIFDLYQKNVQASPVVKPFHLAATAENGTIAFYEFPILYSEYNTLNPTQFANTAWVKKNPYQKIEVEGKKLDELLQAENATPQIIKIDVEGAEFQVLQGLAQSLHQQSPMIAMEYLTANRDNRAHQEAVNFLTTLGYQSYLISSEGKLLQQHIQEIDAQLQRANEESDNIVFKK